MNGFARRCAALGEASEADGIGFTSDCLGLRSGVKIIPCDIFLNREMSEAISTEAHFGGSSRRGIVLLNGGRGQIEFAKSRLNLASEFVPPYPGDGVAARPQSVRVIGKIRRCATHLSAGEQQVPENFANTDDIELCFQMSALFLINPDKIHAQLFR